MEEYIVAPAVRKDNEVRVSRFSHAELIGYDYFFKGAEQGFITNLNRFVDRKEALVIAKKNNENLNKLCKSDELYSEDLFLQEHELINKNKELEKERDGIYRYYQMLGKEKLQLETMVELMGDSLSDGAFYMDEASEYCEVKKKKCDCYQNKLGCKECLLEHFRKKARGE